MNDPKYAIVGGVLWHVGKDGPDYPIPDDEPVVLLRGKDPIVVSALTMYILKHPDGAHRASASERLAAITAFQLVNPDRVNSDCSK